MNATASGISLCDGSIFDPFNPREGVLSIKSLAHHLSTAVRFRGALAAPLSVAEHSVRVSWLLRGPDALAGLLHDGSEAVLSDVPTPIKRLPGMFFYREAEEDVQALIYREFGPPEWNASKVKAADEVMLHTEAFYLMEKTPEWVDRGKVMWGLSPFIGGVWGWEHAREMFMNEYGRLAAMMARGWQTSSGGDYN